MSNGERDGDSDSEGCGTFGCMWVAMLAVVGWYGVTQNWTMREGISWTISLTFVMGAGWLVADTLRGWWRKWRNRRGR